MISITYKTGYPLLICIEMFKPKTSKQDKKVNGIKSSDYN